MSGIPQLGCSCLPEDTLIIAVSKPIITLCKGRVLQSFVLLYKLDQWWSLFLKGQLNSVHLNLRLSTWAAGYCGIRVYSFIFTSSGAAFPSSAPKLPLRERVQLYYQCCDINLLLCFLGTQFVMCTVTTQLSLDYMRIFVENLPKIWLLHTYLHFAQ